MERLEVNKIYHGNALEVLKTFPAESIDTIITSPPYWGLRDYGEGSNTIWGGAPDCDHEWDIGESGGKFCIKCGAWYGQLGLEPTLEMYLEHLLQITAELKRVLKKDGVMFWNQGDSYGGSGCGKGDKRNNNKRSLSIPNLYKDKPNPQRKLRAKSLVMQNYRLILRMLDEQGWILRNIVIWHKPNHMPSSVKDRFTNAYEPVFMLVKSKKYWFDLDSVRVPHEFIGITDKRPYGVLRQRLYPNSSYNKSEDSHLKQYQATRKKTKDESYKAGGVRNAPEPGEPNAFHDRGKNPGDVWEFKEDKYSIEVKDKDGIVFSAANIPFELVSKVYDVFTGLGEKKETLTSGDLWSINTQPFPESHFAVFPEKLVEPMIKAACPQQICRKCGEARVRITNKNYEPTRPGKNTGTGKSGTDIDPNKSLHEQDITKYRMRIGYETVGWTDCGCNAGWRPGVVLDPFMGSGTTALVALKNARNFVGIEANPKYIEIAMKRIKPYLHIKNLDEFMEE